MFKSITKITMSFALVLSMSIGLGLAVDVNDKEATLTVKDFAYMDIETAPAALKDDILESREAIIFDKSWTVDGQCYVINEDGTREDLPEFYDLFPSNWDIPQADARQNLSSRALARYSSPFFRDYVKLYYASNSQSAYTFYTFQATGATIYSWASSLYGSSCNIGYSNGTGASIGYKTYLGVGEKFACSTYNGGIYGVRASTYSSVGNAMMNVSE